MFCSRRALSSLLVAGAVLLSVASTGHRSSRRLPVNGYRAASMFPQLLVAAEELGYDAYEHKSGVNVDVGGDRWVYFHLFKGDFSLITEVPDHLQGAERDDAETETEQIGNDIWRLALELRAELEYGPRRDPRDHPRRRPTRRERTTREDA